MSLATVEHRTRLETETSSSVNILFNLLLNPLVLDNIVPYLSVSSLLHLASTNRAFRDLVFHSSGVFRHLDLTRVKTAQFDIDEIDHGGQVWNSVQLDENLTEDDFYSGPLRGIFATLQRRDILRDVQTLILDGLSVTAELCSEIINGGAYNVRLLSIRDVRNLNQGKLRGALQYACRNTRPEGSPKLKALYVFGSKDAAASSATASGGTSISAEWNHKSHQALSSSLQREGDAWWSKKGRIVNKHIPEDWANCLLACEGIIAFDAVLCQGPRHRNSPAVGKTPVQSDCGPAVATFALPPCEGCGKCPEGMTDPDSRPGSYGSRPLLAPPPILSSVVSAATTPRKPATVFAPRCMECLRERYCTGCHKWWCESCYTIPVAGAAESPIIVNDEDSLGGFEGLEIERPQVKAKVRTGLCERCTNENESAIPKAPASR